MKTQKIFIYQYVAEYMAGQVLFLSSLLSLDEQKTLGYVLIGSSSASFEELEDEHIDDLRKAWQIEGRILDLARSLEAEKEETKAA